MSSSFSAGDKVRRKRPAPQLNHETENGSAPEAQWVAGCSGVVKAVRQETAQVDSKKEALMYQVLWDNGTLSCVGPEFIEKV
jgi:NADPH-dependent ferric siderophore reductase